MGLENQCRELAFRLYREDYPHTIRTSFGEMLEDSQRHYLDKVAKLLQLFKDCLFPAENPEIVCLCGSTRFHDAFRQAEYDLEFEGKVHLSVGFLPGTVHGNNVGVVDADHKARIDALHRFKIAMSDRVHVINVGGYIGDSTKSEIEYAVSIGVPVTYLETQHDYVLHGV